MPKLVETEDFVAEAVRRIVAAAAGVRGRQFRLSLCGGGTPKAVYAALVGEAIDWGNVLITFGDERAVPPDHADSNYRMVREALLDHVPIPDANVIRIRGELPPEEAALVCENELRERAYGEIFAHDLTLLGMGEDGHTASLFPGSTALDERGRWVVANPVPQMNTTRISFTYPLINASREVMFLITGDKKRRLMDEIHAGGSGYPAEGVQPDSGRLCWLVGS